MGRPSHGGCCSDIIERLLPDGEVVIGIDDTIERRWGARISARGIYRDPVRSSRGHFVKTSGLRWLSLMVAVPIPWAKRTWALPFLTILPSARWSEANGKRHKTLTTWPGRRSCRPNTGCQIAVWYSLRTAASQHSSCWSLSAAMSA